MSSLALGIGKIAQCAAAFFNGPRQHLDDGLVQTRGPGAAQAGRRCCGAYTRPEQGFRCVNIANPDNHLTRQQNLLDGGFAAEQAVAEQRQVEGCSQRLHPELAQQFLGNRIVLTMYVDHRTKTPWVVQTQHTVGSTQIKMVVFARQWRLLNKRQTARHAQVQHQEPVFQVQQQVFTSAPYRHDVLLEQNLRLDAQWPTQRHAEPHTNNLRAGYAPGKTQAGDFDFWQFGHGQGLSRLDYYGPMSLISRLFTLTWLTACICGAAHAAAPKSGKPDNSTLDGELFYQLLVGEMSAQSGDNGSAFSLMLDAARKANSARLYERAVEIAYQSRNGEAALEASHAWVKAFPSSKEANRYQFQILLGLNKIAETQEPIRRELAGLAPTERVGVINMLPRYFARTTDKKLAATVVEKTLALEMVNRITGPAAWTAVGTIRLQANDTEGALEAIRRGVSLDAMAQEPVLLAISMIGPKAPGAEAIVRKHLLTKPAAEVRMGYARSLAAFQRFSEAHTQTQLLSAERPDFADAWLMRGSLEIQDNQWTQAEASLKTYVTLTPPPADPAQGATMGRGLVQAYLMLAQVAEQGQRLDDAKAYLVAINSPSDALRVQRRQAGILARQGKVEEARLLIRQVPELQASDALDKINAEVQLLRDNRQFVAAYELVKETTARYPEETELLYDQAMLAEKLGKAEEMESLLRKVMQAKPDYHHAYNALGYSLADRNVRLDEARQLIKQALVYAPDDPFITDSLAWVEFRSGNAEEALRLLRGAYQARPDAEIAAHLGEVLWTVGQREQAAAVWKEGLGLNPQNETLQETMRRLRGTQ